MFEYTSKTMAKRQYFNKIQDVHVYDCAICNQTWLKRGVI